MIFKPGTIELDDTLVLDGDMGGVFAGSGPYYYGTDQKSGWNAVAKGTRFVWRGPKDQPAIVLRRCLGTRIADFGLDGGDLVVQDVRGWGTSMLRFERLAIVGGRIQFGETKGDHNAADCVMDQCFFRGGGVTIKHEQGVNYSLRDCHWIGSDTAVHAEHGGCVRIAGGGTYNTDVVLRVDAGSRNTGAFSIRDFRCDGKPEFLAAGQTLCDARRADGLVSLTVDAVTIVARKSGGNPRPMYRPGTLFRLHESNLIAMNHNGTY